MISNILCLVLQLSTLAMLILGGVFQWNDGTHPLSAHPDFGTSPTVEDSEISGSPA